MNGDGDPAVLRMRASVAGLPAIGLDELNASAELMDRVDRKYFVPQREFDRLVTDWGQRFRVLDIGGVRSFDYRTVYFDSSSFALFRQHVQYRRFRYKVRVRDYRDSGFRTLEVKSRGYRGRTVKTRQPHDRPADAELGADALRFVRSCLAEDDWTAARTGSLHPVVVTDYRRTTLIDDEGDQRITCDVRLRAHHGDARFAGPDAVLVETKSPDRASDIDRWLVRRGIRPHSVSKYCIAAALCHPHLPTNPWHRTLRRFTVE